jgi:hypothetical protein
MGDIHTPPHELDIARWASGFPFLIVRRLREKPRLSFFPTLVEECFSDSLALFGAETEEEDDGFVYYGRVELGAVPKVRTSSNGPGSYHS